MWNNIEDICRLRMLPLDEFRDYLMDVIGNIGSGILVESGVVYISNFNIDEHIKRFWELNNEA